MNENTRLKSILKKHLNYISVNAKIIEQINSLLIVNSKQYIFN